MGHWDDEEAVAGVGNTGQGVVPGGESSQETEESTSLDNGRVRQALVVALDVSNSEQQEAKVQSQEEREEGNSGLQGAKQQDESEDEPALMGEVLASASAPAVRTRHTIRKRPMEL